MTIQNVNNGDTGLQARIKINQSIAKANEVDGKQAFLGVPDIDGMVLSGKTDGTKEWVLVDALRPINFAPNGTTITGTATGGGLNSLVDSSATWTENQHANKVCEIRKNGIREFALVLSNSSSELVFDQNAKFEIGSDMLYSILETLAPTGENNKLIALDVRTNRCAILLPKSSEEIERKWFHIYIEKGDSVVPIMTRLGDLQLGERWGYLGCQSEGVRLYAHTYLTDHFDVLVTYNIKRLASGNFSAPTVITETTAWQEITAGFEVEEAKRFALCGEEPACNLTYISLFPRKFFVNAKANILKTGGTGECEVSIRVKKRNGDIVDYDQRASETRFGTGEGRSAVFFSAIVDLEFMDAVLLIARKTAQNFTVEEGSTLDIIEA